MKCPKCYALNCASDEYCIGCRTSLANARAAAAKEVANAATPQWAYLFAAICGMIPVITLGGAIPAVLGVGGASSCLGVARMYAVSPALRFIVCFIITILCWVLLVTLIVELNPNAKAQLYKLLHHKF